MKNYKYKALVDKLILFILIISIFVGMNMIINHIPYVNLIADLSLTIFYVLFCLYLSLKFSLPMIKIIIYLCISVVIVNIFFNEQFAERLSYALYSLMVLQTLLVLHSTRNETLN